MHDVPEIITYNCRKDGCSASLEAKLLVLVRPGPSQGGGTSQCLHAKLLSWGNCSLLLEYGPRKSGSHQSKRNVETTKTFAFQVADTHVVTISSWNDLF